LQKSYAIEIALNDLNIGSIYLNLQDNKNAIANFEEALSHAQDGADSPDYTRVFVRANQLLGNIYFHEEAYEDSWKYYSKCMEADAQLKNFLSPFDVLELKEKAGISCVKSSDNNDKQSCKSILMKAKDFLNHQNWPQEQRTKVEEIGKKIDLYLN
jgi:tetratricopeptide (TPR) repeat protein